MSTEEFAAVSFPGSVTWEEKDRVGDLECDMDSLQHDLSHLEYALIDLEDDFRGLCRWLGVDPWEIPDSGSRPTIWRRVWTWLTGS